MVEGAGRAHQAKSLSRLAAAGLVLAIAPPAIAADISFQAVENGTIISRLDLDTSEVTAEVITDPVTDNYVLELSLAADRVSEFEHMTRKNTGRRLRIVVDGSVLTEPVIREPVRGGQMWVSGTWSKNELSKIAEKLN